MRSATVFPPIHGLSQVMNLAPSACNLVGGEGNHLCTEERYALSHPP